MGNKIILLYLSQTNVQCSFEAKQNMNTLNSHFKIHVIKITYNACGRRAKKLSMHEARKLRMHEHNKLRMHDHKKATYA